MVTQNLQARIIVLQGKLSYKAIGSGLINMIVMATARLAKYEEKALERASAPVKGFDAEVRRSGGCPTN
ncbi:hypothetical protein DYI21_09440 [Thalassospira tepidiphila]|nr:hypothetical protein [Thalassospira tepidiphila]HCK18779.1 hypothetical protein [Thalassospira sp.]